MVSRIEVRLGRAARNSAALRGTMPVPGPGEWRHQSIPAHRPAYFPRPAAERAVIGHASYAARPETPGEAAAKLDLLDYDFHLFTERSTGQDSVINRTPDGCRLAMVHPKPSRREEAHGHTAAAADAARRGRDELSQVRPAGLLVRCRDAVMAIDGGARRRAAAGRACVAGHRRARRAARRPAPPGRRPRHAVSGRRRVPHRLTERAATGPRRFSLGRPSELPRRTGPGSDGPVPGSPRRLRLRQRLRG
jgi:Sigma 54 modulation/S30EA ribosomal protein C terminus